VVSISKELKFLILCSENFLLLLHILCSEISHTVFKKTRCGHKKEMNAEREQNKK
jgi:hypothetical protein